MDYKNEAQKKLIMSNKLHLVLNSLPLSGLALAAIII